MLLCKATDLKCGSIVQQPKTPKFQSPPVKRPNKRNSSPFPDSAGQSPWKNNLERLDRRPISQRLAFTCPTTGSDAGFLLFSRFNYSVGWLGRGSGWLIRFTVRCLCAGLLYAACRVRFFLPPLNY